MIPVAPTCHVGLKTYRPIGPQVDSTHATFRNGPFPPPTSCMNTAATPLPNGLSVLVEESGDCPYIPTWPRGHDHDMMEALHKSALDVHAA